LDWELGAAPALVTRTVTLPAGAATLSFVDGETGARVTLLHGETLHANGSVLVGFACPCACCADGGNCANQSFTFITAGAAAGADETYRPTFAYSGFRWVQVDGWPAGAPAPTAAALSCGATSSAVEATGSVSFGGGAQSRVLDGVQAQGPAQASELWALRESISESLSATGMLHKNDISLPIAELSAFCARFESVFAARYPGWEICLFGHIGDGNLHVNVMKPDGLETADFLARTKPADEELFTLVQAHHGSISAEHGIGLLKKPYLHYTRSPAELGLLQSLKATLDPHGILNPGKILG
jgi:FAD/FMN-containing dehydrogenase